jgi:hypothetical protein
MTETFQLFLEDMLTYLAAQEAGLVQLRMQINKILSGKEPSAELPFKAEAIKWQQRQNQKGLFEIAEDVENPDHKALLKFLTEHTGNCLVSQGFFYWTFPDLKTVGRKRSDLCRKKGGS